ncbi:MAG: CpsD/CapB family tyrosine-protein kinase [Actinomycetota bacterium]
MARSPRRVAERQRHDDDTEQTDNTSAAESAPRRRSSSGSNSSSSAGARQRRRTEDGETTGGGGQRSPRSGQSRRSDSGARRSAESSAAAPSTADDRPIRKRRRAEDRGEVEPPVPIDRSRPTPARRSSDEGRRRNSPAKVQVEEIRPDFAHPEVIESMRYILNRHELITRRSVPRSIAVVSALHGEGVTTLSLALAETLARDFERSTCWIDLSWEDGRNQALDDAPIGLREVIDREVDIDEALARCDETGLRLLAAGRIPPRDRHRLARSGALDRLIEDLGQRFETVVFDSPPVLTTNDSLAVVRHAESHLLVTKCGSTTASQVKAAAAELERVPQLGVVLNQFRTRTPKSIRRLFSE